MTKGRPADAAATADGGWFRTGDVGYLDEDGYLFISGRLKEIINRGGEKIAPGEVDHVLLEHPAVAQAVTCAVPDARLGEDLVSVIVRRPGSALTEREVREFASTRLAAFKVPRRVMFVEQIPKGPTGKIQRIGLAAKLGIESLAFAQPGAAATFAAPATPLEIAIADAWREVLEIDRVGLHDNFFELGGDSLAAAEVITRVEARLGLSIDIRDMGFGTLQQVAAGAAHERPAQAGDGRDSRPRAGQETSLRNYGAANDTSTDTEARRRGAAASMHPAPGEDAADRAMPGLARDPAQPEGSRQRRTQRRARAPRARPTSASSSNCWTSACRSRATSPNAACGRVPR